MNRSDAAIARRKLVGFLWMAVICFFSLIPVFFVSALANLDAVSIIVFLWKLRVRMLSLDRYRRQDIFLFCGRGH